MNNDMKCPICQTVLDKAFLSDKVRGCPKCKNIGNIDLWQELIRTRKELEQSETCCTEWEKQALDYKAENIALSGDLERTRKVLDRAKWWLNEIVESHRYTPISTAEIALKDITALEQKDVK